jgi:hypothetical protein
VHAKLVYGRWRPRVSSSTPRAMRDMTTLASTPMHCKETGGGVCGVYPHKHPCRVGIFPSAAHGRRHGTPPPTPPHTIPTPPLPPALTPPPPPFPIQRTVTRTDAKARARCLGNTPPSPVPPGGNRPGWQGVITYTFSCSRSQASHYAVHTAAQFGRLAHAFCSAEQCLFVPTAEQGRAGGGGPPTTDVGAGAATHRHSRWHKLNGSKARGGAHVRGQVAGDGVRKAHVQR